MNEGPEDQQKTLEPVYCDKCHWHLFDIEIDGGERTIPKEADGEATDDGFYTCECPNCGELMKILPPTPGQETARERPGAATVAETEGAGKDQGPSTETGFGTPEDDDDF